MPTDGNGKDAPSEEERTAIDREVERALLAEMSTVERFSIRVIRQVGGVHCARVSGPYMQRKERREWKRRPEKALSCSHGSLRQCLCLS